MSDPNYWPHTAQMDRRTFDEMRTFVANTVRGLTYASLPVAERSQVDASINQEAEEWRAEFAGISGFVEREETIDWPNGNTRIELPADFAETESGARAVLLDANGNEVDKLELASRQAWDGDLGHGIRPKYENRLTPIAYLHGVSDNGRRMLSIVPTPTADLKIRLNYHGLAQKLAAPTDELEAPVGMHGGIETGSAARFALYVNSEKWQSLRAEAERQKAAFRSPQRTERKRPGRMLSFHEADGYSAYEFPDKTHFVR